MAAPGDDRPAPVEPRPARHRWFEYLGMLCCGLMFALVFSATNRKPGPPPFVPSRFVFWDDGARIHVEGCFSGDVGFGKINEQRLEIDVPGRTIEVNSLVVARFSRDNELIRISRRYRILSDDGDLVVATSIDAAPNSALYTLQISRKSHTVAMTERFPWGIVLASELKDGPTVYRRIVASRRP